MVQGTPVQLRTSSGTWSSETGRVFIQDSSCCRLPQHYLWRFHGQPLQGKGSRVALGEQSSIPWPVFLLCKWVSGQGAMRRGTGEKQGRQALPLSGHSQLLEWPFGHHAARMYKICVGRWSDPWQSIRFGRSRKWSTAIFLKHPLLNSNNPRSPDSQKWEY